MQSESESDESLSEISDVSGDGSTTESSSEEVSSLSMDDDDEDDDDRNALLPDAFRDPEAKLVISDWGLSKLRKLFMGQVIPKDERAALTEKYYCGQQIFQLFQPPKFGSSALSLLKHEGTNASRDASFIHSDINFGMRLLISLYEKQLSLKAKFSPETKSGNKIVKAGAFADLEFPFKSGFAYPNPRDLMNSVSDRDIAKFKRKFDGTEPVIMDNISRYAIGYKNAFMQLAASVTALLNFGEQSEDALTELRSGLVEHTDQVGDIARIVGNASQSLKSLREKDYLAKTDSGFKNFIQMRKSGLSKKELQEEKLSNFTEQELVKSAKDYCKVRRALASVTKDREAAKKRKIKANAEKKVSPKAPIPKPGPSKARKFAGKKKKAKQPKKQDKEEN